MNEKKLKTGKLSRAFSLGKSVAKIGLGVAKDKLSGEKNFTATQIKAAKEMIETMGELKGGLMKVGQMISVTGNTVLPEEVSALFTSLQSSSSFMPQYQLEECFIREFSKLPEDLYKNFDRTPFAAASIGQVHKAVLHNGTEVAVKVQYPDIESAIEDDLKSIDKLEGIFDILKIPKPQMENVLKELKRSLIEECDYHQELSSMTKIKESLEVKFPQIKIPKAYPEFSTGRILTTEFVSGERFESTLDYTQKQKDELGLVMYESFLYSLYDLKHLHTDPQNGNYLFQTDKIFLFDFGSTRTFSSEFLEDYALLQYAVERMDASLYRQVGKSLGIILDTDPDEFVQGHMELVEKIYKPFLGDGAYFAKTPNPFGLVKEFISNMNYNNRPAPKEEFILLDRANVGLFMKLQSWESRIDWKEGMKKYRQETLDRAKLRYNYPN